jgi:hypothetical protein
VAPAGSWESVTTVVGRSSMTDEFKLPEYDEAAMREIWFDDHADFAKVETRLEDATRWGHTESKVVRHVPSDTLWMFTADVASGDHGETTVDDELTRVYPHEATIVKYTTTP